MRMKRKKRTLPSLISPTILLEAQLAIYQPMLAAEDFAALQDEVVRTLPVAIRLNPLKTDNSLPAALTHRYGWILTPIPFCPQGYRVDPGDGPGVSAVIEHKAGMFYIQEAASMLPVELFSPLKINQPLTLDLAASPGGKTTHLVANQKDAGLVLANDSSQGRIQALKIVLQRWGATNSAVTRFPGEKFGSWFPNTFDRVLIDAPCSMQGLRVADSHETRPVTEKESRALAQRQTALLSSALQAVKPGGEVVYSTCTLLPAEDEGVVDAVLRKFGNAVTLLDAQSRLPHPAPGLQNLGSLENANLMNRVVRLWPHRYQTAGFFACIFQKTENIPLPVAAPPSHSMETAGFVQLTVAEEQKFSRDFEIWTGYDLEDALQVHEHALVRRDQRFFLFPRIFLNQFRGLPVQSAGIMLGEFDPEGFIPSHEWVLRFGLECTSIRLDITGVEAECFGRGEDLPGLLSVGVTSSNIRVVVDDQGRVLGRGRLQADRLKNLSSRQLA